MLRYRSDAPEWADLIDEPRGLTEEVHISGHNVSVPEGELREVLVELCGLLDDVDERFWAGWARDRLVALDSGALDPREVRRAFGGMGSLTDLLLHPFNGHTIEPHEVDAVNTRLRDLRSRLWVVTG